MIGQLINHLWQSTLFAIAAGLLAIGFRKNQAQIRYWFWLSASVKFLAPLSLLVGLGSHLGSARVEDRVAAPTISLTIVQITQPFPQSLSFVHSAPRVTDWFLITILSMWVCGFGTIVLMRFKAWHRIRAALRSSTLLEIPAAVEMRSSPGLLEPGVVGLFKSVLLLPEGMVERLTPPQLDAVLAHELCHVWRRDNLTAAIHMIVEAVFWFHPLVWWIGVELVKERERACDEEVLRLGSEPQVYAKGILSICKFYAESPLTCVAGITGSNLRRRVELIMRNHVGAPLSAWRKLFLATVGLITLAVPVILGVVKVPMVQAQSSQWETAAGGKMKFDRVSVRQNTSEQFAPPNFPLSSDDSYSSNGGVFSADFPLSVYIEFAYKVSLTQEQIQFMLASLPKWVATDRFEIHAWAKGNPTKDQMRLMMQSLLEDRFKLALHFETRQLPVFALTVLKSGTMGPNLRPHADGPSCDVPAFPPAHGSSADVAEVFPPVCDVYEADEHSNRVRLGSRNTTMALIAASLPNVARLGRPVIDQTGLSGKFDFTMEWAPLGASFQTGSREPTFLEALQEQLGLNLESQEGPVEILVVDHVETPSGN